MKKAVLIGFIATVSAVALPIAAVSAVAAPEAKAASCARGTKPAVIGANFKCLRVGQQCAARYQRAYRKYGFHCAKARLRKGTGVAPPSSAEPPYTPPPAPTPTAVDGHYKGLTSQNETIEFDIEGRGSTFRGLETKINENCTPRFDIGAHYLHWKNIPQPHNIDWGLSVSSAGDLTIDTDLPGWHVGDWPAKEHLTMHGHMAGQAGLGSIELKTSFVADGVAYTCGSGLQTWTVTKTG